MVSLHLRYEILSEIFGGMIWNNISLSLLCGTDPGLFELFDIEKSLNTDTPVFGIYGCRASSTHTRCTLDSHTATSL